MGVMPALEEVARKITLLHDLGMGNAYGEMGSDKHLIVLIASGESLDFLKAYCQHQGFDQE